MPAPSPPVRLLKYPWYKWHDALKFLPSDLHDAFFELADALDALASAVHQRFPMEGATLVAYIYPSRGVGRLTWRRGGRFVTWRITNTNPAAR